jgi:GNAT superfamily N-acetyltransferase
MDTPGKGLIETLVTYLEMTAPPAGAPLPPPRAGLEVKRAIQPTISFYRYLYDAIGRDWTWYERKLLDDGQLAPIIHDPRVEVNVLFAEGVPAGLAELDFRDPGDVELAYFGVLPEFIGQGLGRFLLDWAVHHAWRARPRRLWVHTCDLDHPRALGVYQKAGFRIYDRRLAVATPPS